VFRNIKRRPCDQLKVSYDSEDGRLEGAGISLRGISMSDNEYVRLGASGPAIALQTKPKSRWR
jgi:hypothetical protein